MSRPRLHGPANFRGAGPMFSGPPGPPIMMGPGSPPPQFQTFPNQFQNHPRMQQRPRQPNNIWCPSNVQTQNHFQSRQRFGNVNESFSNNGQMPGVYNANNNVCGHPRGQYRGINNNRKNYHDRDNPAGTWQNNQHGQRKRFHNNGNNKKKQKVNKRDTEEHNQFFCDSCDRGFKTNDKFQEHIDQHQKCTYKDCTYIAAPKLVQLHIRLQHSTGLARKIWHLESKEEIEKWIAERKKNYPTAGNIARKESEQKDRIVRGEVIETKYFGRRMKGKHDRNQQRGNNRRNRKRRRGNQRQRDELEEADAGAKKQKTIAENRQAEDGAEDKTDQQNHVTDDPLSLLIAHQQDSEDDSPDVNYKTDENVKSLGIKGGLGMILSSYDDEENSENEAEQPDIKASPNTVYEDKCSKDEVVAQKPESKDPDTNNSSSKLELTDRHQEKTNKGKKSHKVRQQQVKHKNLFRLGKKSTLLEKLLAKEIRHERNVILQCVHYIVKNDFFSKSEATVDKDTLCKGQASVLDIHDKVFD